MCILTYLMNHIRIYHTLKLHIDIIHKGLSLSLHNNPHHKHHIPLQKSIDHILTLQNSIKYKCFLQEHPNKIENYK